VSLGQNVLVGFRGQRRPNEIVLLGAHYDHAGINAAGQVLNGGNDNASGVAALLEVAAGLTAVRDELDRSVVIAFFAAARQGFQGSDMLLHDLPLLFGGDARPVAMLSLRAVGHDDGNPMLVVGGTRYAELAATLERHDTRNELLGPVLALRRFDDDIHELRRVEVFPARVSDHSTFARTGVPAVLLTDGMDPPPLPDPDDDWRDVDSDKVARVARLVLRAALDLSSAPSPATLPAAAPGPRR
jgi:Zn-dependent M28 family amino/carboxypeptidase